MAGMLLPGARRGTRWSRHKAHAHASSSWRPEIPQIHSPAFHSEPLVALPQVTLAPALPMGNRKRLSHFDLLQIKTFNFKYTQLLKTFSGLIFVPFPQYLMQPFRKLSSQVISALCFCFQIPARQILVEKGLGSVLGSLQYHVLLLTSSPNHILL